MMSAWNSNGSRDEDQEEETKEEPHKYGKAKWYTCHCGYNAKFLFKPHAKTRCKNCKNTGRCGGRFKITAFTVW